MRHTSRRHRLAILAIAALMVLVVLPAMGMSLPTQPGIYTYEECTQLKEGWDCTGEREYYTVGETPHVLVVDNATTSTVMIEVSVTQGNHALLQESYAELVSTQDPRAYHSTIDLGKLIDPQANALIFISYNSTYYNATINKTIHYVYDPINITILEPVGSVVTRDNLTEYNNTLYLSVRWNTTDVIGENQTCDIEISPDTIPPWCSYDNVYEGTFYGETGVPMSAEIPETDLSQWCDGLYTFTISCTDEKGNNDGIEEYYMLKLNPPVLDIHSLSNPLPAWNATLEIMLLDESLLSQEFECNVTLNNQTKTTTLQGNNDYEDVYRTINLTELFGDEAFTDGDNNLTIECRDSYYASEPVSVLLEAATTKPLVYLESPENSTIVNEPVTLVVGTDDQSDIVAGYEILVALDPSFDTSVTLETSTGSATLPGELSMPGEYYWKARPVYTNGEKGEYTPAWTFTLARNPTLEGILDCEGEYCTLDGNIIGTRTVQYSKTSNIVAGKPIGKEYHITLSSPPSLVALETQDETNLSQADGAYEHINDGESIVTHPEDTVWITSGASICAIAYTTNNSALAATITHEDGHSEQVGLTPQNASKKWWCVSLEGYPSPVSNVTLTCSQGQNSCYVDSAWISNPQAILLKIMGIEVSQELENETFIYGEGTYAPTTNTQGILYIDIPDIETNTTSTNNIIYTYEGFQETPVVAVYGSWSDRVQDPDRETVAGERAYALLPVQVKNNGTQEFTSVTVPAYPNCPDEWECEPVTIQSILPGQTLSEEMSVYSDSMIPIENKTTPGIDPDETIRVGEEYSSIVTFEIQNKDTIPYEVVARPEIDGWKGNKTVYLYPGETRTVDIELYKILATATLTEERTEDKKYTLETYQGTLHLDPYGDGHDVEYYIPSSQLYGWSARKKVRVTLDGESVSYTATSNGLTILIENLEAGDHDIEIEYYTKYLEPEPVPVYRSTGTITTPQENMTQQDTTSNKPAPSNNTGDNTNTETGRGTQAEQNTTIVLTVSGKGWTNITLWLNNTGPHLYNVTIMGVTAPKGWDVKILEYNLGEIESGRAVPVTVMVKIPPKKWDNATITLLAKGVTRDGEQVLLESTALLQNERAWSPTGRAVSIASGIAQKTWWLGLLALIVGLGILATRKKKPTRKPRREILLRVKNRL